MHETIVYTYDAVRLGSGRELVAEGTARRAAHDCLGAVQAHLAIAGRGDVEIGLADQQRTELGFAQGAKELGEAAARHVDFQRLLVMASNLELDLPRGDLAPGVLQGRPFAPRAASMPSPIAANSCFDQSRKACFTMAS